MVQLGVLRLRDGSRLPFQVPTDPTMAVELSRCVNTPSETNTSILRLQAPGGDPIEVAAKDVGGVELDPPFSVVENFLSEAEAERAMAHALAHVSGFQDSTISNQYVQGASTPDTRLRRSRILNDVGAVVPMIGQRLHATMPRLWSELKMQPMNFTQMECQLSVHGDGDFFNTHTDNALPDIAHRVISYVYYFHKEPKRFSGGHLRIYKSVIDNGVHGVGDLVADIDPPRNGLIIFPSYIQHEVTPVQCASNDLADQRLTLNGWLSL